MAQNQTTDNSGTGVVLGVLLAIVIAIGAYFFIQNRDDDATNTLEPAAGIEAPTNDTDTPAPAAQ
jgi:hypothetical protein